MVEIDRSMIPAYRISRCSSRNARANVLANAYLHWSYSPKKTSSKSNKKLCLQNHFQRNRRFRMIISMKSVVII